MDYEDRKPKQLEIKRKEHYNRIYLRQKQLMKRLRPFLNTSDIIEAETEPFNYLKKVEPIKPKLSGEIKKVKEKSRKKLREKLSKFSNNRKKLRRKTDKKISQIRPDVLWGMR